MRFLDACARRPVDATPVWLMRQAGRYLPEYRAIREKLAFIEMCKRSDVAAEVTLQPLRRFELDAAIVFADILLPLEPHGHRLPPSRPRAAPSSTTRSAAAATSRVCAASTRADELAYVMETLRLVRRELRRDDVPLIGFAGAPFTLASYVVEGGHSRNYAHVKQLMLDDPATFARLMDLLSDVVASYLLAQIEAGAQAVQLFDSWVGWLSPYDYERVVLPYVRCVVDSVRGHGAPVIYFANGAAGMLPLVAQVGADVIGVDWRVDLDTAWAQLDDAAIQGNLDPAALLGPTEAIEERAADVLRARRRPTGPHLQSRARPAAGDAAGARQATSSTPCTGCRPGPVAAGGPDGPAAAQAAKEDA